MKADITSRLSPAERLRGGSVPEKPPARALARTCASGLILAAACLTFGHARAADSPQALAQADPAAGGSSQATQATPAAGSSGQPAAPGAGATGQSAAPAAGTSAPGNEAPPSRLQGSVEADKRQAEEPCNSFSGQAREACEARATATAEMPRGRQGADPTGKGNPAAATR
jgi:hypothetical protein